MSRLNVAKESGLPPPFPRRRHAQKKLSTTSCSKEPQTARKKQRRLLANQIQLAVVFPDMGRRSSPQLIQKRLRAGQPWRNGRVCTEESYLIL